MCSREESIFLMFKWNILQKSDMCNSYIILILPLYLCLDELIMFIAGVLKLSTIIDLQLIFVFISMTCFMKTWDQKFGSYILITAMFF